MTGLIASEIMPFQKFCHKRGRVWQEETIWLKGSFKREGSDEVIEGDIFEAHKLSRCSLYEIYKLYIEWFNYTIRPNEKKRIFVNVRELTDDEIKIKELRG